MGAFPINIREHIKERAEYRSELTGKVEEKMEVAHLVHGKKGKLNKDPRNGMLVTTLEHLAHHMFYQYNPRETGLTEAENNSAIASLWERLSKRQPIDPEEIRYEVGEAIGRWEELLNSEAPREPNLNETPEPVQTPIVEINF
jgi:hypothetical protein